MEYVEIDDRIVIRLDYGDDIMECLERLRSEAEISGGFFSGIGALDRVTLGHYDPESEEYTERDFEGQYEVTAFLGTIRNKRIHAHITCAASNFETIGGHFSGGRVSGIFEIIVHRASLEELPDDPRTGLEILENPS